jgi:predicted MFS family arabinose efflux permease
MKSAIKIRLIICSLVLFVTALGINVFLNSSSVDRLYDESTIAQYRALGENLKRKLVGSLKTGRSIDKIEDMGQILTRTEENLKQMGSEKTPLSNFFASARYRSFVKNLKNSVVRILDTWRSIIGFGDVSQTPSKTMQGLQNSNREVKPHPGAIKSATDSGFAVSLTLPNNMVAYSTSSYVMNYGLPEEALTTWQSGENKNETTGAFQHIKHYASYYLTFPIRDEAQTLLAEIVLTIPENRVRVHKNVLIIDNIAPLIWILCGGIFLLVLSLNIIARRHDDGQFYSKTKISLMVFFVIFSAQISFSGVTAVTFKDLYLKMNKEKARMSVGLFKEEIESFLSEGNRIDDLSKQDVVLSTILSESPELNDITLFNKKWHPLFIASQDSAIDCRKATYVQLEKMKKSLPKWDPKFNVRLTVTHDDQIQGYISADISKSKLLNRLVEILLDSITVLVISILFLVEMMILSFNIIEKGSDKEPPRTTGEPIARRTESPPLYYGLMRPAAFLLLFGYDISMSFLPLHTEKLYTPLFGLSKDVIMGLPISVELLFVGFSILIAGVWLDRRGWHEPFVVGIFLAGGGILYSWGAPDVLHFIFSRAIAGTGYGLALMASQGFVIEYSDSRSKAQGLANLFAGIYAGSICGGATGAMLADRFDYNTVFFTGSVILFSVIIYTFIFMRKGMKKPQEHVQLKTEKSFPMLKVSSFLSNRIVIALIFFSSLPAAIAVVGFLNYFSPIYLNRIGASQSTIGRILMIYGICLIYIGPLVGKYVDASSRKRLFIFLGCALGSLAFLTFNVVEGLIAAAIAVLLLGLSSSFVLASQSAYTLKLKVTQELGAGKSIGIFRSTSRAGQVLGPIIFSWLVLATNIRDGITYFGIAYFGLALIFLLLTVRDKKLLAFNF